MFPVYGSYEKRFYTDLKNNIAEYTKKFPDANISDLESEFGSLANVIREYLSNVDSDYL